MSYFDDHYDPEKFKFNNDKDLFSFSWTTPKPPTKQGPPFWVFGVAVAVFVIWAIFKKICYTKKYDAPETASTYSNNFNLLIPRTMPVSTIISEYSRYSPSSNFTTARPPTSITPTAPYAEHQQPQVFQPTAPRIVEDSPPHYDEAMKIINQQKDHNSSIT